MSLNSSISLSFTVDKGCFRLATSSVNPDLDEKISAKAGINFKQIADNFKATHDLSKHDCISVTLTPKDNDYILAFKDIPDLAQNTIKLSAAFVKAISGTRPNPAPASPPPTAITPPPKPSKDLDDWVMLPSSKSMKTIGILNNTTRVDCFMNAVMQVIMHNPLLKKTLTETYGNDNSPKAQSLMAAIKDYDDGKMVTTTALREFMPQSVQKGQQDANEFLNIILNGVDNQKHPDLFAKVKTAYTWERKEGFIFSKVVESINTSAQSPELVIPLHLPSQVTTVINGEALIKGHFSQKKHAGDNYIDRVTGKSFSPGLVQVSLENQPPQLVFSLNRFTRYSKVTSAIQMPDNLTINSAKYTLKQIVMHHGQTMGGGHYTALLKDEQGGWTHADDTRITPNAKRSDLTDGYLYFYERS